jgi:hypothetical protein
MIEEKKQDARPSERVETKERPGRPKERTVALGQVKTDEEVRLAAEIEKLRG